MELTNRDPPAPSALADQLRRAFTDHGDSTEQPWNVGVRALPCRRPLSEDPGAFAVRVTLTLADVRALVGILHAAALAHTHVWLSTNAVADMIHVSPGTIRAWLSPRYQHRSPENPFPAPRKRLGRNEWNQAAIVAWMTRREMLKTAARQQLVSSAAKGETHDRPSGARDRSSSLAGRPGRTEEAGGVGGAG